MEDVIRVKALEQLKIDLVLVQTKMAKHKVKNLDFAENCFNILNSILQHEIKRERK